jgi:plastocyanin
MRIPPGDFQSRSLRRSPVLRSLLLGFVAAQTACGGRSDQAASQPAAPPPAAATAAAPNVVTITATDFAFQAPDSIPAGVTAIRLVNQGKELHHVFLVKAKAEELRNMNPEGPPPPGLVAVGGPNGAVPGGSMDATVDLVPGDYTIICVIPSADGMPHVMKGMARPLVVTAGSSAATFPAADITIKLTDYAFGFSPALTPGHHVIRIENDASQLHEILIVKLAPGKTAADVEKWALKPVGPPPGMPIGGATPMSTGQVTVIPVDLTPGDYGLLCFVPDAKDGRFHVVHGMIQDLKIS